MRRDARIRNVTLVFEEEVGDDALALAESVLRSSGCGEGTPVPYLHPCWPLH